MQFALAGNSGSGSSGSSSSRAPGGGGGNSSGGGGAGAAAPPSPHQLLQRHLALVLGPKLRVLGPRLRLLPPATNTSTTTSTSTITSTSTSITSITSTSTASAAHVTASRRRLLSLTQWLSLRLLLPLLRRLLLPRSPSRRPDPFAATLWPRGYWRAATKAHLKTLRRQSFFPLQVSPSPVRPLPRLFLCPLFS